MGGEVAMATRRAGTSLLPYMEITQLWLAMTTSYLINGSIVTILLKLKYDEF